VGKKENINDNEGKKKRKKENMDIWKRTWRNLFSGDQIDDILKKRFFCN